MSDLPNSLSGKTNTTNPDDKWDDPAYLDMLNALCEPDTSGYQAYTSSSYLRKPEDVNMLITDLVEQVNEQMIFSGRLMNENKMLSIENGKLQYMVRLLQAENLSLTNKDSKKKRSIKQTTEEPHPSFGPV
jgi:hypothetical protein